MSKLRRGVATATVVALMAGSGCIGGGASDEAFCERLSGPRPGDPWVDVDFVVFVNPEADEGQVDAIRGRLDDETQIEEYTWVDQDEAYAQFVDYFAATPEMIDAVSPEILPASARVTVSDQDPEAVRGVGQRFENRPGVYRVVFAGEFPRSVIDGSIRPLTVGSMWMTALMFTAGRSTIDLAAVAPEPMREPSQVLDDYWASDPSSASEEELEVIATAARQVAAYYDTECT